VALVVRKGPLLAGPFLSPALPSSFFPVVSVDFPFIPPFITPQLYLFLSSEKQLKLLNSRHLPSLTECPLKFTRGYLWLLLHFHPTLWVVSLVKATRYCSELTPAFSPLLWTATLGSFRFPLSSFLRLLSAPLSGFTNDFPEFKHSTIHPCDSLPPFFDRWCIRTSLPSGFPRPTALPPPVSFHNAK